MDASEISKLARALQTPPKYISLKPGLRLPPLTPPQSLPLSRHTRWSSSDVIQSFQPVRQLVVRREISTIVICWLHRSSCRISQSDCLTLLIPPTSAWVYLHTTVALSWKMCKRSWVWRQTHKHRHDHYVSSEKTRPAKWFLSPWRSHRSQHWIIQLSY